MSFKHTEELFGKVYPDGTIVFRENDRGEEMFIIQDGEVEISSTSKGEKTIYGMLKKGNFFGEMALFDDQPRSATATVRGSARLMVLHRDTVRDRLRTDPHIGLSLLRSMCERIRSLHQSLEDLIARGSLQPRELDAVLRAHLSH
ncbi:MAG: cyclic nucleotide-binding domain-containing protein [Candidatus Wallbacteria bacterium]|nr:cyclic nucleotide-binding domain-containing protein [Candidatus Wallbacteria bacterium]